MDQIVVEVETAKAAVEVPIPFAGTVSALHGEAGESVAVGAPLISVGRGCRARRYRAREYSGNVLIGYGTAAGAAAARRRRAPVAATRPRLRPPAAPTAAHGRGDLTAGAQAGPRRRARPRHDHGDRPERADHAPRRRDALPAPAAAVDRTCSASRSRASARRSPTSCRPVAPGDPRGDGVGRRRRHRPARGARRDQRAATRRAGQRARAAVALRRRRPAPLPRAERSIENDEIVLPRAVNLGFAAQTGRAGWSCRSCTMPTGCRCATSAANSPD